VLRTAYGILGSAKNLAELVGSSFLEGDSFPSLSFAFCSGGSGHLSILVLLPILPLLYQYKAKAFLPRFKKRKKNRIKFKLS
jgi:hypothetical protein